MWAAPLKIDSEIPCLSSQHPGSRCACKFWWAPPNVAVHNWALALAEELCIPAAFSPCPGFAVPPAPILPVGYRVLLRCTAVGAGGHRTSPAPLGIPPAGQFLLCNTGASPARPHGPPCSPARCHSAGAQHSHNVNRTWESCLNKQRAYFTINMQKASFNMLQLKQQHCQDPFLQPHPPPLSQTSYWS